MNLVDSSILDRYIGWRKQQPEQCEGGPALAEWKAELERWYQATPEATQALEQAIAKVLQEHKVPAETSSEV